MMEDMVMKISTGIDILDYVLGGGLSLGYVTELAGYPWKLLKTLLHRMVIALAGKISIRIFYNQYFEGLDPYLLSKYSTLYKIPMATVENNIKLRRSFKPDDYIKGLERVYPNEFIVLVDPFLNVSSLGIYSSLYNRIRRLIEKNVTIVIFNRLLNPSYPAGGHIHRHSVHYLISIRQVNKRFVEISITKALDSSERSFYVEYQSLLWLGGKGIQYALSRWVD